MHAFLVYLYNGTKMCECQLEAKRCIYTKLPSPCYLFMLIRYPKYVFTVVLAF